MLILYQPHCQPPYCAFAHSYKIKNGDDIWPNLRRLIVEFMKVRSMKTWKELTTGVEQLVSFLFNNKFISHGLVLEGNLSFVINILSCKFPNWI